MPHGPHSLTREEVLSNQRERLVSAMTVAVGEQGYSQTTVAHVISIAGVSRKAFYQHFSNREACFLETYDTISADCVDHTRRACLPLKEPETAVRAGIDALFDRVREDPLEVRILLVEIAALGREGAQRREALVGSFERMLRHSQLLGPDVDTIPAPILRAIVGGISYLVHGRVREGRERQLHKLVAEIVPWISCYQGVSQALLQSRARLPPPRALDFAGGRAPGSLWPSAPSSSRRRGLRGEHIGSHSFVVHSQRERVLDAVATLSATKGYTAVTVKDISETAAVSLDAFYEHFEGKEDAFLVAYEIGHGKARSLVEGAYDAAPDWSTAVQAAITAIFQFVAAEPAFAHLSLVDARVATSRAADRAIKGMSAYTELLVPRMKELSNSRRPPSAILEAIAGGIFELCVSYTLQNRTDELPQLAGPATLFALAPFLGVEEAARVANSATDGTRKSNVR